MEPMDPQDPQSPEPGAPEQAAPEASAPEAVEAETAAPEVPEQGPVEPLMPAAAAPVPAPEPAHFRAVPEATPVYLPLERLTDDTTWRLRPEGEVSQLATDVARLGQLFPVDVRPVADRFELVCGFRRVAALRFLQREQVLARVHPHLSDEDALLLSLAAAIHGAPVGREALGALRERLEAEGRLTPAARDMFDKALAEGDQLAPEGVEEEVDADELAADVTQRLGDINQDLSLLADVFGALDGPRRAELIKQLRYSAELVAYLEGLSP